VVGGNAATFTRATLSETVFHALGDWTWARGALPPPRPCGIGERRDRPDKQHCDAWAGSVPWRLTWVKDRRGTFLVEMRALVP
jgi:hypothetical protein